MVIGNMIVQVFFFIVLNDCDLKVVVIVVVVFFGQVDNINFNLLVVFFVDNSIIVIGVGIEIFDNIFLLLKLDGVIFLVKQVLVEGINMLCFIVCYKVIVVMMSGQVNVDVIFIMKYE